jgi:hypothetical protein
MTGVHVDLAPRHGQEFRPDFDWLEAHLHGAKVTPPLPAFILHTRARARPLSTCSPAARNLLRLMQMLVLVNPCNPSGALVPRAELEVPSWQFAEQFIRYFGITSPVFLPASTPNALFACLLAPARALRKPWGLAGDRQHLYVCARESAGRQGAAPRSHQRGWQARWRALDEHFVFPDADGEELQHTYASPPRLPPPRPPPTSRLQMCGGRARPERVLFLQGLRHDGVASGLYCAQRVPGTWEEKATTQAGPN